MYHHHQHIHQHNHQHQHHHNHNHHKHHKHHTFQEVRVAPCREMVHSVPDPRSNFTLPTILLI